MRLSQRLVLKYVRTKFKLLSSISKRKAAEKAIDLFFTPQHRNKKNLPKIFEQSEKLHFSFEGSTIRGYRWNHPAEKKILILHGFESSVINFDRYIKPLVKKDYEVLAFDAPAHGRSSGKMLNALIYQNLIEHIDKEYGPVSSFIGHSMGGLALSLFLENKKDSEKYKAVFIAPATESTTAADSFFKFLKLDDEVRKEFDSLIKEQSGQDIKWYSVARASQNTKAKILWMHDRDDDMTPLRDVEPVMAANPPHIEFYITEGLGHRRIYRDNIVAKKIIDFL